MIGTNGLFCQKQRLLAVEQPAQMVQISVFGRLSGKSGHFQSDGLTVIEPHFISRVEFPFGCRFIAATNDIKRVEKRFSPPEYEHHCTTVIAR